MRWCRSGRGSLHKRHEGPRWWWSRLAQSFRTRKRMRTRRRTWWSLSSTRRCRRWPRRELWATTPKRLPGCHTGWSGPTSEEDLPGRTSCSHSSGRSSPRWDCRPEDSTSQAQKTEEKLFLLSDRCISVLFWFSFFSLNSVSLRWCLSPQTRAYQGDRFWKSK